MCMLEGFRLIVRDKSQKYFKKNSAFDNNLKHLQEGLNILDLIKNKMTLIVTSTYRNAKKIKQTKIYLLLIVAKIVTKKKQRF